MPNSESALADGEHPPTLDALIDRALDLTGEERAAWLEGLRARAPALAAELSALLAGEATIDREGFLARPLAVPFDMVGSLFGGPGPHAGLQLGSYVLERPLGQGGMGSVWLARRADGRFEGRAAIKFLHLALLTETGQERFRREGSMLARLAHPGIARLLDAGVTPGGQPYLVLEHVDGEPIDRWADAHAPGREARVRLVLRVIDAVAHAHANLIVHRDLKPSNILVTRDGAPKLLDFGIAKLLDDGAGNRHAALTNDVGPLTPDYATPEQVRGEAVTTATDVYALGVLLYALVSGRHPTAADARTPAEAMHAALAVEPARLGLGDLDTILAKALRKAPHERYQAVAALADDLERYLRHEPVRARPDTLVYRARRFARRHRAAVGAAAVVATSLVTATVVSLGQMREARRQRDAAVRANRHAAALTDLQGVLAGDTRDPDGRPLPPADRIALAERILTRQFRTEPALVAEVMSDLAASFFEGGDFEAELEMLARARAIARDAGLPLQTSLADCHRATTYWYLDRFDSARAAVAEAKAALARARRSSPAIEVACLEAEGKLLQGVGQADSGIVLLRRAVALAEAHLDRTAQLAQMNALAEVLRLALRTRESIPYQRRVLAELEAAGYGETEVIPNVLSSAANSLWDLGEMAATDSLLRHFVRLQEAVHGPGRVAAPLAFFYGRGKLYLGALDSADVWVARGLRDTTQGAGTTQLWLHGVLAQLRLDQGRLQAARAAVAQLPTAPRGRRATGAMLRAQLRRAEGDTAGAAALLERELTVALNDGQPPLAAFTLPLVTAGEWRLAAGDARGADSLAEAAWRAARIDAIAAERSGLAGRARLLSARVRRALGDTAAARAAARQAVAALASGYGSANKWTQEGRALLDSLLR
jgi:serine/threonine-protein kinase